MSERIEHQHYGLGKAGPLVYEYPLPFDLETIGNCPAWLEPLAGKSQVDAVGCIRSRWANVPSSAARRLADWFARLTPISVARMENDFWLALSAHEDPASHNMHFLPHPDRLPDNLPLGHPSIRPFLEPFLGIRHGPYFFPCEEFHTSRELVHVRFDDEEYWWGKRDSNWEDALAFYRTPCGNIFVIHPEGHIGKWLHDDGPRFARILDSLDEFVDEYMSFFSESAGDGESPFLY